MGLLTLDKRKISYRYYYIRYISPIYLQSEGWNKEELLPERMHPALLLSKNKLVKITAFDRIGVFI